MSPPPPVSPQLAQQCPQNLGIQMKTVPGTSLVTTEPRVNGALPTFSPTFSFRLRLWEDGGCSIYTVTASVFDGCCLGGCCLFILEVICEDDGPSFWARRQGEETKSKKQELKLGANVYCLTCPLALTRFSSAPLTMFQDGGTAHL